MHRQQKTAETEVGQSSVTVDQILTMADQGIDNTVVVEGLCSHICSHGGKKLLPLGATITIQYNTIRVESNDAIGAFQSECVNSIVKVKVTLKEERIDEAYLINWEAQIAEGTAEEHGDGEEG